MWHTLDARFTTSLMEIGLDDHIESSSVTEAQNKFFDLSGLLFIGGLDVNRRARAVKQGTTNGDKRLVKTSLLLDQHLSSPPFWNGFPSFIYFPYRNAINISYTLKNMSISYHSDILTSMGNTHKIDNYFVITLQTMISYDPPILSQTTQIYFPNNIIAICDWNLIFKWIKFPFETFARYLSN